MRLSGKLLERRFLLLHLLILGVACVCGIKVSDVANKTSHETTPKSQYAVRETTTTDASPTELPATNGDRKLVPPIVVKDPARNATSGDFRPSVHLGEIEQPSTVIRMNPFNSVQLVKFENNVQLDARREHVQDVPQDAYQGVLDEATRPSRIKFQDDDDQRIMTEYAGSSLNDANVKHVFADQTFFQNVEKPTGEQDASAILGKTMADHQLVAGYLDTSRLPYVIDYYSSGDQSTYQPHEVTYEVMKQPENGVLLLQQEESTYTRKRKFPYQFYQPSSEYHEVKYTEVPRHSTAAYPPMRKVSPWKKIIRLIGTFLPLGLLLATLTPNVVRINNTSTQPNIVLSKLRVADLPAEHKHTARLLDDQPATCEDRSICELIVAGSEPKSSVLQNILWNLASKISDDVAARNGLGEVFEAVRKKDCTTISC